MIFNEGRLSELNEKYKEMISQNPEWEKTAERRNRQHVIGVQTFGKKIGYDFPDHDADKFNTLYIPYVLISMGYNPDYKDYINAKKKEDPDMDPFMRWASFSHITNNRHHPEAWDIESATLIEKDRESEQIIDATKMEDIYIIEMCCDWASVGAENGNSPQSWFALKNGKKWKFTEEQEDLIWKTLEEIWPGGRKETAEIKHKERYFNDVVWEQLNQMWDDYNKNKGDTLIESYDFGGLENAFQLFSQEKNKISDVVGTLKQRNYEPTVSLPGVGSLQALSFLFSPAVTSYVLNLLDSITTNSYSITGSEAMIKSMNLDKVEFGKNYGTKAKITSNFANGILKSLDNVNQSKLKNKILLVSKFIKDLKRHAKTISDKAEKEKYIEDVKAFIKVIGIVKNIIDNRSNFINVLQKTLLLQESEQEITSDTFLNIYEGI